MDNKCPALPGIVLWLRNRCVNYSSVMPTLSSLFRLSAKSLLLAAALIPATTLGAKTSTHATRRSRSHKHVVHHHHPAPVDTLSYAARLRMLNRARLLNHYRAGHKKVGPAEIASVVASTKAERAKNRRLAKAHPEWFRGPWKLGDSRWDDVREHEGFLSHDHLHNMTEVAIHRMEVQLGKPYVWGGTTPDTGFDCSGLVFYAYNKVLADKLPRTANQMYHYRRAIKVAGNELRRGDLLFFRVHSHGEYADHMGVYLGHGQFIQSPRTGESVQVSQLQDDFWQQHFLGARRILTDNTIL